MTSKSSKADSGCTQNATESTPLLAPSVPVDLDNELNTLKNEDLSKMDMFWEEMRIIPRYALPVFGSQILEYSMIFVPVISVGHISTTSLAAISLGVMTSNVTGLSILQGLASALDTLLPSAWTSSQPNLMGLWVQRMAVVLVFTLAPILLVWFNAESILLALKQDPEVARLAAIYLRWASFGLPAFAYNCISRRYLQSQGLFFVQTRIIMLVAPVNVLLNYMLVWGPDQIRLGYIGAPIATAISTWLISLTAFIHAVYLVPRTAWQPLTMKMFTNLGLVVWLGLSGIAQVVSEWWAWEFLALAASLLGPVTLASQSVLITTAAMAFQISFSIASATTIRIGHLLGEANARRAAATVDASLVVAVIASLLTSTLLLICRNSWAKLFNNDPVVASLVATVLPLIAFFQFLDSNGAVTGGILRARGKQFIGALLNVSAYYVIGLPLGGLLAFHWELGLHGLWIGLTVSLAYIAVTGTILAYRADWAQEVTKVAKRNSKERLRKLVDVENLPAAT